jgi:dTDP-4-amino-4,6-dideoxygalactose transaminase
MQENLSSYHLYIIRFNHANTKLRDSTFRMLREQGYFVNIHYIPIYRQPYYKKFKFKLKDFPQSELYYSEGISIPLHPSITKKDQLKIVEAITTHKRGYQSIF